MRIYQDSKEMLSEIKRDLFEMWEEIIMNSMQNKKWKFKIKELQWYEFMLSLMWKDKREIITNLFRTDEFILAEIKKFLKFVYKNWDVKKEVENFMNSYLNNVYDIMSRYYEKIKQKNLFEILWFMTKEEYLNLKKIIKENWEEIKNYVKVVVSEYYDIILNNKDVEVRFDEEFKNYFSKFFKLWTILDFVERIDERLINPWEAYKVRIWVWWQFKEWDKFSYTYWERIMKYINTENWKEHQLNLIIKELVRNISTRQAVLQIFDWNIDLPNMWWKHRIPCSLHYQFMVRSSWKRISRRWIAWTLNEIKWLPKMIIFYNMRSVDFLTHFPIDIAQAINLMSYVKSKVEKEKWIRIEDWELIFSAQSLHAYSYDVIWKVF